MWHLSYIFCSTKKMVLPKGGGEEPRGQACTTFLMVNRKTPNTTQSILERSCHMRPGVWGCATMFWTLRWNNMRVRSLRKQQYTEEQYLLALTEVRVDFRLSFGQWSATMIVLWRYHPFSFHLLDVQYNASVAEYLWCLITFLGSISNRGQ
jgi:hypothetical protein